MKGFKFNVHTPSLVAGGAVGLVCGSALGYVLARRTLRDRFARHLDAEVDAVKAHYNEHLKRLLTAEQYHDDDPNTGPTGNTWAGVVQDTLSRPIAVRDKAVGYGAGPSSRAGKDEAADRGDQVPEVPREDLASPLKRNLNGPHVIDVEELGETPPGWQQITITWYTEDNVVVDDKEQPIRNPETIIGPLTLDGFGGISGDPNIRYVRSPKLEVDFEIILDRRSYTDVVLGYGQPNRAGAAKGG